MLAVAASTKDIICQQDELHLVSQVLEVRCTRYVGLDIVVQEHKNLLLFLSKSLSSAVLSAFEMWSFSSFNRSFLRIPLMVDNLLQDTSFDEVKPSTSSSSLLVSTLLSAPSVTDF